MPSRSSLLHALAAIDSCASDYMPRRCILTIVSDIGYSHASEHWHQIASANGLSEDDLVIRFVEYHRMVQGAGLANPKHYVRYIGCQLGSTLSLKWLHRVYSQLKRV